MSTQPLTRPARPRVVEIAAIAWWAAIGIRSVVVIVNAAARTRPDDGSAMTAEIVALVVLLGVNGLLTWLVLRMWRGGPTARLWLAILAGLGLVGAVISVATGRADLAMLESVALAAAAVLTYLPSARRFFPKVEPRPRRREPKTLGWDPETGERIVEEPELDRR